MTRILYEIDAVAKYRFNNSIGPFNSVDNQSNFLTLVSVAIFFFTSLIWTFKKSRNSPIVPLIYLISVLMVPLSVLAILLFGLIRKLVNTYLQIKYGKAYGGLLGGGDVFWAIEGVSKNIINTILLIDTTDQDVEALRAKIIKTMDFAFYKPDCVKITGIRQYELGYTYLLKNQYTAEDGVDFFSDCEQRPLLEESDLEDLIGFYSNKPLPKNDCATWQILIGQQLINWKGNKNIRAVLLRIHHTVGDGSSLIRTFLKTFSNNPMEDLFYMKTKDKLSWKQTLLKILDLIYTLNIAFAHLIKQTMAKYNDSSIIYGKELSGDKITVWRVEENHGLVAVVKNVKNRIPETKFSDVILSAISAGISNYFNKKSELAPMYATSAVPIIVPQKELNLKNTFSIGAINVPINVNYFEKLHEKPSCNRLEQVKWNTNVIRNVVEYKVNYWLLNVFMGILPEPILKVLLGTNTCTMSISNLPGSDKITIFDGCSLKDVIFFVPHREKTGVGVSILTYDNRFQIGFIVDKALMSSKEDAHLVLNGIFQYITTLCEELNVEDTHINTH